MGTIFAIANQRSGVGKTTIAHNLSVALALEKKKVLMVDLDSQANLTVCAAKKEPLEYDGRNIVTFLTGDGDLPPWEAIYPAGALKELDDYLFIIPSIIDLELLDRRMRLQEKTEYVFENTIKGLKSEYDYVILDCPSNLGVMTMNALSCADYVIAPCKTDGISYRSLHQLDEIIYEKHVMYGEKVELYGVFVTLFQSRIKADDYVRKNLYANYHVIAEMKMAIMPKKGIYNGISIVEYMPEHEISKNITALAKKIIHDPKIEVV